jgi:putative transposase
MVTTGIYEKLPHLNSPPRLDFFLQSLFACAAESGWQLQAWAVLANHYHFIAQSPADDGMLPDFIGELHRRTARQLNLWDESPGREVWHQFWHKQITVEPSYLARLHYVHHNPAQHGVVALAENYKWCSAAWFARHAPAEFVESVRRFKDERVEVPDDF